jgi:hypothetical protein
MASLSKFRHRPSPNLPASDYSPFMVELFTFADLLRYPRMSLPGTASHEARGSPRRTTSYAPEVRKRTPCVDYAMPKHGLTNFDN